MTRQPWPLLLLLALAGPLHAGPIEFNRDVRPILSEFCFACHGPDSAKRKAGLRLDTLEGAKAVLEGGKGHDLPLVQRLTDPNPKKRMPPASTGKALAPAQMAILRAWIDQGAPYQLHWSFLAPTRPPLPAVRGTTWPRNPIDRFLLARLEAEKLQPSPPAEPRLLLRRLNFDLLGLPPSPAEVDAFSADPGEKAYEKVVDRLLASRHFGERMAVFWLDLVRFADTAGYHSDNHRDIHLFRDYVIAAFNDNKRFDQFTVEQLAGDLLPSPTPAQRIASGYNRLLQTTEEGGAQAREYLAKYASDRVRNAGSVWLGLTLGCAECHNHKFDPVSTREFYQFASFWADISEVAVGRQPQTRIGRPEQEARLRKVETELAELRTALAAQPVDETKQLAWEKKAASSKAKLPRPIAEGLKVEPMKRTAAQKKALADHYRTVAPELAEARKKVSEAEARKQQLESAIPQTLVSTAVAPRMMRVLPRGNWLDESGEVVAPNTPGSLPKLAPAGKRATRLDLARWIVSADQPLTARVFVNRLWKLFFGQGLVTTMEDFGSQGAWPSHPELLDYLAVEFRDSGWDIKHLVRLMVTSAAYRQQSVASEVLKQRDPYNRLLARQARFRLDAELVRDNALAVSGLLVRKVGGPSAKPYQPSGYWAYLNFPRREYAADRGEDQYRRGLYTYVQRTFPHPSLIAFDAPSREECTADRPRSNTPQQALVLLNDPSYVEAARALASRVVKEGGPGDPQRLDYMYRLVLGRRPRQAESDLLLTLLARHRDQFRSDREAVDSLLTIGLAPTDATLDRPSLAAWSSLARVLLNLHETITRE